MVGLMATVGWAVGKGKHVISRSRSIQLYVDVKSLQLWIGCRT